MVVRYIRMSLALHMHTQLWISCDFKMKRWLTGTLLIRFLTLSVPLNWIELEKRISLPWWNYWPNENWNDQYCFEFFIVEVPTKPQHFILCCHSTFLCDVRVLINYDLCHCIFTKSRSKWNRISLFCVDFVLMFYYLSTPLCAIL